MKFRIEIKENAFYGTSYYPQVKEGFFFWKDIEFFLSFIGVNDFHINEYKPPFKDKENCLRYIQEYKKYLAKESLKRRNKFSYEEIK